jgi:hypothetical protein
MMLEHDEIAIAILMFGGIDDTVGDGKHRGTSGRVVHAFVGSPGLQDRVQACVLQKPELICDNSIGERRKALRRLLPSAV